jgi:hypothetical protein
VGGRRPRVRHRADRWAQGRRRVRQSAADDVLRQGGRDGRRQGRRLARAQHPLPPGKIDRKTPHNIRTTRCPTSPATRSPPSCRRASRRPSTRCSPPPSGCWRPPPSPPPGSCCGPPPTSGRSSSAASGSAPCSPSTTCCAAWRAALDDAATRDAVRAAIRQRYRVALIDEFQDTDSVQWRIFDALFGGDEPFILIGDPKQAIYAFRGADVHTYVHARDSRPDQRRCRPTGAATSSTCAPATCCSASPPPSPPPTSPTTTSPPTTATGSPTRRAAPRCGCATSTATAGETTPQRGAEVLTKGWAAQALPPDVAAVAVSLLDGEVTVDAECRRRTAAGAPRPRRARAHQPAGPCGPAGAARRRGARRDPARRQRVRHRGGRGTAAAARRTAAPQRRATGRGRRGQHPLRPRRPHPGRPARRPRSRHRRRHRDGEPSRHARLGPLDRPAHPLERAVAPQRRAARRAAGLRRGPGARAAAGHPRGRAAPDQRASPDRAAAHRRDHRGAHPEHARRLAPGPPGGRRRRRAARGRDRAAPRGGRRGRPGRHRPRQQGAAVSRRALPGPVGRSRPGG